MRSRLHHAVRRRQFGHLDKPRADLMIDESAKKAIKPRIQDSQKSRSSLVSRHF